MMVVAALLNIEFFILIDNNLCIKLFILQKLSIIILCLQMYFLT